MAGREPERRAQALDQAALRLLVAQRDGPAQVDEAAGVDAGAGRVAVDERRQHRETVRAAGGLDREARWLAPAARQPPRLDFDGHAALERRQQVRHEQRRFIWREATPDAEQLLAFAAAELERCKLADPAFAQHEAAAEIALGRRVVGDAEPEASCVILQPRPGPEQLTGRLDRAPIE
jgi:hypothetical protein